MMWFKLLGFIFIWYVVLSRGTTTAPSGINPNDVIGNPNNASEGSQFLQNVKTVLDYLSNKKPPNDSSTIYVYGLFPDDVYAFFECYNTTASNCRECLHFAREQFMFQYPLAKGCRAYPYTAAYACYLRYENNNFNRELKLERIQQAIPPASIAPPASQPSSPAASQTNSSKSLPPTVGVAGKDSGSKSHRSKAIIGAAVASSALIFVAAAAAAFASRLLCSKPKAGHKSTFPLREGTRAYSYQELSNATKGFSEENKLGQGGFGTVYKGVLQDGRQIAIKKLFISSDRAEDEFINEVNIVSSIQHRSLVRLEGYCVEGQERMLVFEYLVNGSAESALFGRNIQLDWRKRQGIVLGVAKGLAYLHEDSHIQIIHRDIKLSNILLDSKLDPKISDFGVSKLFNRDKDITTSTRVAGTLLYMAPEYALRGQLTTKADVYSFGVLVLEIVSGRRCHDRSLTNEQQLMLEHAWKLHSEGILENLADSNLQLTTSYMINEVLRTLKVALLCIMPEPEGRPTMSEVVAMLLGYLELPPLPSQPPQPPNYFQGISQIFAKPESSIVDKTSSKFLSVGT